MEDSMENIIELKFSIPGEIVQPEEISRKLGDKVISVSNVDGLFYISFVSDAANSDEDNTWLMFCDIAADYPQAVLVS